MSTKLLPEPVIKLGASVVRAMSELLMSAADIRAGQERTCGACSLCCKVLTLVDPAIAKPAGAWCKYCLPGKGGCGIYAMRPSECSNFKCNWLHGELPEEWYPFKSKMVSRWYSENGEIVLGFYVDPKYPKHWKKEPYYSHLKQLAALGFNIRPVENTFSVRVIVGNRCFFIQPTRDIECRYINDEERSAFCDELYDAMVEWLHSRSSKTQRVVAHYDWCAIYDNKECNCKPIPRHVEPRNGVQS